MVSLELVNNCDSNLILLALMPLLLPSNNSQIAKDNIVTILGSPLANKLVFLRELDVDNIITTDFDAASFKIHFLGVIASHMKTPTVTELFTSVDAHQKGFFRSAMDVSHIMLLVIACLNQRLDSNESLKIFKQIRNYTKDFEIKHIPCENWQKFRKRPYIPLRLYIDFVSKVVEHTNLSDDIYNWQLPNKDLEYLLYIVNFISEEVFRKEGGSFRHEWLKTIQQIFGVVFPRPYTVIDFFANFYVYRDLNCEINYTLLRLRACILFSALCRKLNTTLKFNLVQILKITMGLHASSQLIRFQAISVLSQIKKHAILDSNLLYLVDTFLSREREIFTCHEQAPLLWYTLLKPTKEEADERLGIQLFKDILKLFTMRFYLEHSAFISELLSAFKHIDDMDVLQVLMPLAFDALDHTTDDGTLKVLAAPFKNVYNLIMQRFELADSAEILMKSPGAWELFKKSCQMHNVYLVYDDRMQPVPCLLLNVLDGVFYGKLNKNSQLKLFKLILRTLYTSDNDTIFQAANKMFNKCIFEGNMLRVILQQMLGDLFKTGKTPLKQKPSAIANAAKLESEKLQMQITTQEWKEGVIVLQLLEQRKIILHTEQLISVLFDLLKVCLEVEEQNTVEYAKQLILAILLQCCEVCKEDGIAIQEILPENTFRIDHIVDYVRSTQNPQTHHNALLLLAHCAALYPQQVLHNIVQIFTFVGSTIARHDDAFSFYIINTVVEKIVPILLEHGTSAAVSVDGIDGRAIPLLKVFSDIMFDVPEHRRLLLYTKFLKTLGHKEYLWSFLCILFEAHITDTENERKKGKQSDVASIFLTVKTTRFLFAIDLVKSLETSIILETCLQLLTYVTNLPLSEQNAVTSDESMDTGEVSLYDVKCHTKRQFRHYKYLIIEFLHNITCEHSVMLKIARLTDEEQLDMKTLYQSLVVKILTYIPKVKSTIAEQTEGHELKLNKAILNYLHDLLENVILMLSPNLFLMVINGLVLHNIYSIRRKVMELLINKLLTKDTFFSGQFNDEISKLFEPFNTIVDTIGRKTEEPNGDAAAHPINTNNDAIHMQQTTLICIKVLSKAYGTEFIEEFKGLLAKITKVLKLRKNMPRLLTSAVIITIAEIASNLRVHSLAYLPRFMPYLINILQEQTALLESQPLDNSYAALVLSKSE
ncbi:HEAT repeat-containing protein 1 homolog [Teleopsis dalmanni]|uniref:HEAT repeat-containing protein 1 homolog n=1 Tax=Teleopsis dalmanni TaxID=139649 RepID=UPI0018CD830C|nr:HEAT repeat-containing protein 1 homolog [Teleopsis dalmanni]